MAPNKPNQTKPSFPFSFSVDGGGGGKDRPLRGMAGTKPYMAPEVFQAQQQVNTKEVSQIMK